MKHLIALLISLTFIALACSRKTAPAASQKPAVPKVTYAADIGPLLLAKCTPCHYPDQQGRKEPLNSYAAAQQHINDIIARVELPQTDAKFMPFKLKKPALTADEITLLKNWARGGFVQE